MGKFVKIASLDEIPEEDGLVVEVQGREIGLFRVDGQVHAINNICPHRGGPLAEGQREGKLLTCPWHAWTFDITTGKCTFNDRIQIECFQVKLEDGFVYVAPTRPTPPEQFKTSTMGLAGE